MFGGRRRPVLGAAVVMGASRNAARREVASQNQAASNAEMQRRLDQQDQDLRTQQAIDAALAKERAEKAAVMQREEQDRGMGGRGEMGGSQPPPYIVNQNLAPGAFFCGACGALGNRNDTFCSGCGRRHPKETREGSM